MATKPLTTVPTVTEIDGDEDTIIVTDTKGREIVFRGLDPVERFDIADALGDKSTNLMMFGLACRAAGVRSIDGVPRQLPVNLAQIKAAIRALGDDGQVAIAKAEAEREEKLKATEEKVKNS